VIVSRVLEPAGAAAQDAAGRDGDLRVSGTPWSLGLARGPGSRPALEVYEGGTLLDVIVATPLASEVLRGARRALCDGQHRALAWGRLMSDGSGVQVTFSRRRIRTMTTRIADVTEVSTWFWVAVADGYFGRVSVVQCRAARAVRAARAARDLRDVPAPAPAWGVRR
jgi:hypothetical protein